MSRDTIRHLSCALWIAGAFATSAVAAGAQRTFVASTGDDSNPCSIAMPCRSFGGAIAKTGAGGEVVVLDSAGYGAVSVTQSVTITAPTGIYAGISVFSGAGVTVNGAGINVILRGLAINFQAGFPAYGIDFVNGASLIVERCRISGEFDAGINQEPGLGSLLVRDTVITGLPNALGDGVATAGTILLDHVSITGEPESGLHVTDGGIVTMHDSIIDGAGANANAVYVTAQAGQDINVSLDKVTLTRTSTAVQAFASGALSKAYVDIIRSSIVNNTFTAVEALTQSSGYSLVHVTDSLVSGSQYGLLTADAGQLTASGNTIVNNGSGMQAYVPNGMFSMGNNQVRDNGPPNINGSVTVLTFN